MEQNKFEIQIERMSRCYTLASLMLWCLLFAHLFRVYFICISDSHRVLGGSLSAVTSFIVPSLILPAPQNSCRTL